MHTTRFYIPCSKICPTMNCGIDINDLSKDLDYHEMYQLIQDVTLSPVFKNSTYSPSVKQIGWSPAVLKHQLSCLLGMLSDSGLLNICYTMRGKWETDSVISNSWFKYCTSQWQDTRRDAKKTIEELKRRAYKLKLSAFSWGSVLDKQWYLLLAGTLDGTVMAWRVSQNPKSKKISAELLQVLPLSDAYQSPITALYCHFIEANKYMVVVCYLDGRIINILIVVSSQTVQILSQHDIWEETDKIQVYPGGLLVMSTCHDLLLTVIKGAFILVFRIKTSGELISSEVVDSQELLITGLTDLSPTKLLVTAYSGAMYMLDIENSKPLFTKEQNSLRGSHYSCNGLALSRNKAIAIIPYSVKTNYDHLSMKELCHMLWCSVAEHTGLMSIVSTHAGPLSDIWDVFDLLRIESIINNNDANWSSLSGWFNSLSTEELDTMEIDRLKKNLAIMKILQLFDREPTHCTNVEFKNIEEDILELIMSCHVFKRITNDTKENLSEFESKSFFLMKRWLEYFITKHSNKYKFTTTTASTVLEGFNLDKVNCDRELCNICETEVPWFEGASIAKCHAGHEVPRCCLSLVQCGPLAYYKCFNCGVIAHQEAVSDENNSCIYCDNTFKFTEIL